MCCYANLFYLKKCQQIDKVSLQKVANYLRLVENQYLLVAGKNEEIEKFRLKLLRCANRYVTPLNLWFAPSITIHALISILDIPLEVS